MTWVSSQIREFRFLEEEKIIEILNFLHLQVIDVPILILHAEDDLVVPFKLGKALYESALEGRAEHWPKVHWREFSGQHGYAHKFICRAPELPDIIR